MAYKDFAAAFEEFRAPMQKISTLYDASRIAADKAGKIASDGSVSVDFGRLRAALDILPTGNEGRLERAIGGLDRGFAMVGEVPTPLAPWSAFLDAQALRPLGQEFWKSLGFGGPRARPFRGIKNVPADVLTPQNMAMLTALASTAPNYAEFTMSPGAHVIATGRSEVLYLEPQKQAPVVIPPPNDTGTSTLALKPEDFKGPAECLAKARYRFVHLGFTLEICLDRSCADVLENLFSFGTASLLTAGAGLLTAGFTAAAVGSAVASVGGWVAFFIMISAAYWALMIYLNKTPRGVCLYIPMPWTFGVIGPGWAVGN